MNTSIRIFLNILLFVLIVQAHQPQCLLEEPLTNQCLLSVSANDLQTNVLPYMCTITIERQLIEKASDFCKRAAPIDPDSGYNYFKTLLLMNKLDQAFKVEYDLFFADPFSHSQKLSSSLYDLKDSLKEQKHLSQFGKSILYLYKNQTQKSYQSLLSHLQQNNQNKELIFQHFLMSRLQQKQQKYYQALTYIQKIIKTNKIQHPYFYHLRGNFQMHHVNFNKAIISFEKANQLFQEIIGKNGFSFSHYNIGLCYEKQGKIQDAIKYYQKSYLSVHSVEALNALGHASYSRFQEHGEQKYLQTAQKYYKKALQKDDNYTVLIFNLGMLKLAQNQIQEAIQHFQKCRSLADKIQSCDYGLIKAFYLNNQIKPAEQIIQDLQKSQQTIADLLAILYQLGFHKKALQLAGDKEDYMSPQLLKWKGYHQFAEDKYEKAQKSLLRAVFMGGKDAYTYNALGQAQLLQRKYKECAQSLEEAYQIDPHEETKQILQQCKKQLVDNEL